MTRKRVLRVVFVRPAATPRLPSLFVHPDPVDPADVLPVELLRLATTVKLGSPHRVFVHDARRDKAGNRATRGVVTVHRADIAIVQLELSLLGDGLEVARAARDGGANLVLATGPLVRRWPDAVAGMPEFDGVLDPGGAPSLLELLTRASADELDAQGISEVLAQSPSPPAADARGVDRRLLDYAAYRCAHRGRPSPVGRRVDKGRWAASPVLLEDETGHLCSADVVADDLRECALLGIPHLALRAGAERPTQRWLLDVLPVGGTARVVAPAPAKEPGSLDELKERGVWALDLGGFAVGAPDTVRWAGEWVSAARSAGLLVLGRACFGLHGGDAEEEGLAAVQEWGVPLDASLVVAVPPQREALQEWLGWLDAPRSGFRPPVRGGDRTVEIAERARLLLTDRGPTGPRAAAGRLMRWARGG